MTKIKANAATKAAQKATNNDAMAKLAKEYAEKSGGVIGQLQLEYGLKARAIVAADPKADISPLATAFGRQRKAELSAIVAADQGELEAAMTAAKGRRNPGLQQTARALKLIQIGADTGSKAARAYISGGAKSDWYEATGQKPEAEAKGTPAKAPEAEAKAPAKAKGTDNRDDAAAAAADPWLQLHNAIKAIREKELKGNKEALRLLANAEALIKAAAQITA